VFWAVRAIRPAVTSRGIDFPVAISRQRRYAPPVFANEGVPYVIVIFQSLAGTFGFFHGAFEQDEMSIAKGEPEPVWDADAGSVVWRKGSNSYSSSDVVRRAMELLQARSR
jgi:hypothetical protein